MADPTGSLLPGFRVGHWTAPDGSTGCTVVLPPPGNTCACDIRGSAPGSRELASLEPTRPRTEVHAIMLSGGSAYGLAAADGAMAWLEERGIGFRAAEATIPIVPAAVIFDAAAMTPRSRPDRAAGYAACESATDTAVAHGRAGAGAGATVGKWAGPELRAPGGLGLAIVEESGIGVGALAVVNAVGDVIDADDTVIAGTANPSPAWTGFGAAEGPARSGTVLAVVAVRARLSKPACAFVASRGSDGITIAVRPAHTRYDGDVVFAVAAPDDGTAGEESLDLIGVLATRAVAQAVRNAVR